MMYCSVKDLYDACAKEVIEHWAKDSESDTDEEIQVRILASIQRSSEEINLYLNKRYTLPLSQIPLILKDLCVKLALYQLLSRKGFSDDSSEQTIKDNKDAAIRQLELLSSGRLELPISESNHNLSHQDNPIPYHFPYSPLK